MKQNKSLILSLALLILVAALYRVVPGRPFGFAPQWAMAIFGGAVFINNKKWAFALPIFSMLISDALYEVLYINGLTSIQGFYKGQFTNYLLFAGLTCIGFFIKTINVKNVLTAAVASPTLFFLVSNFLVWASNGGYHRPKTVEGLMMSYNDGLPFYLNSIAGTIVFAGILFGTYVWLQKPSTQQNQMA
jgi:hypothetical protein